MNWLPVAFNETHKGLLLMWRYRFASVIHLLLFGLIFVGISFFMGNGQLRPEIMAFTILGYVTTYFAQIALREMSNALLTEAQTGTLEQIYLSPVPVELVLTGRVFATLLTSLSAAAIMGVTLVFSLEIPVNLHWESGLVMGITIIGVFGFGFILGGATLLFKQVGGFATLLQNGLLFLNGSLFPVSHFPDWLQAVARSLPTTDGIAMLRRVALNGDSLPVLLQDRGLYILIGHSLLYLGIGLAVFRICERISKQRGSLGQY